MFILFQKLICLAKQSKFATNSPIFNLLLGKNSFCSPTLRDIADHSYAPNTPLTQALKFWNLLH